MFSEFLSDYIEFIELEKGLSEHTINAYRNDIISFYDYLSANGKIDISQTTRQDVSGYIKHLSISNIKSSSIVRKIASLKGFWRYLNACEKVKNNPILDITPPKIPKKLPKVLTLDEIETLLKENLDTFHLALFELLYATGVRVSELVSLEIQNLNLEKGILKTKGKGSKERLIPIGKKAKNALKKWLTERNRIILVNPNANKYSRETDFKAIYLQFYKRAWKNRSQTNFATHNSPHICNTPSRTWCRFKGCTRAFRAL